MEKNTCVKRKIQVSLKYACIIFKPFVGHLHYTSLHHKFEFK